jgi:hypothetical protein
MEGRGWEEFIELVGTIWQIIKNILFDFNRIIQVEEPKISYNFPILAQNIRL